VSLRKKCRDSQRIGGRVACEARKQFNAYQEIELRNTWFWFYHGAFREAQAPPLRARGHLIDWAQPRSVKRRSLISVCLALAATALIVLGYFSWNASIRRDRAELPRYGSAPEFNLKDQDGIQWNPERLRGNIWVAGFIDVADSSANALLSRFAELDQNFRKGEQLTLISAALPAADQGEPNLVDLARHYLASSRWHFVAGTPEQIHGLLDRWKQIVSAHADSNIASRFCLVDSEGEVRGVYDGRSPEVVQRVLEDVGTLLRTGIK
jgi:cytochrome oxidase Cu insertion factor (SCO1/SenC/PrrC family)